MDERSRDKEDSCSPDGCWGSLDGFTAGGGAGVDSNMTAEYFVDLKETRL